MIKDIIYNCKRLIKRINLINQFITEEQNKRNMSNPFIYNVPKTYIWIDNDNN